MKRWLSLLFILVLILQLSIFNACSIGNDILSTRNAPLTTTKIITVTTTEVMTVIPEFTPQSTPLVKNSRDAEIELANVQTAVIAAMADAITNYVKEPGPFGNTGKSFFKPFIGTDVTVLGQYKVGDYIAGGVSNVVGYYNIEANGKVTQVWFPITTTVPVPITTYIFVPSPKDSELELANVQTAVTAAMADAITYFVAGGGYEENFGNTNHRIFKPFTGTDCIVSDGYAVGDYIAGGAANVVGSYIIATDGRVTQVWYPY